MNVILFKNLVKLQFILNDSYSDKYVYYTKCVLIPRLYNVQ